MKILQINASKLDRGAIMTSKPIRNSEQVRQSRSVERMVAGKPTSDGAGVKLTRVVTQPLQRRLDPGYRGNRGLRRQRRIVQLSFK